MVPNKLKHSANIVTTQHCVKHITSMNKGLIWEKKKGRKKRKIGPKYNMNTVASLTN